MTPEYHCFIGGRNGTANAATSACPATRRQNRNRRNQSTVAYMGGTLVTGRSPHDHRYRTLLWGPRRGNTRRSAPDIKRKAGRVGAYSAGSQFAYALRGANCEPAE